MTIHVTPIPSTLELAEPNFVLTTANAEGSAATAVSSNSEILTFDTSDPGPVAASSVVGVASVAARRDHIHAGIPAISSTDGAIARYNGTAGLIQNYTSSAPTVSDAGVITLASGQITFPATQAPSTDVHTLDDYEEGEFTPILNDNTGSGSSTYAIQQGYYTKIGNVVFVDLTLAATSIAGLNGAYVVLLAGLPFTVSTATNYSSSAALGLASGFASTTAGYNVTGDFNWGVTYLTLHIWDIPTGNSYMTITEFSATGQIHLSGFYRV